MSSQASIEEFRTEIGGAVLGGLRARPPGPDRGLVIALHGGGYDARYWHHPGLDDASLLWLGASLGFEIVALDRPGYASSAAGWPNGQSLLAQAESIFAMVDAAASGDRPIFLIGHSMGGILALMMGADARGARLSGIDVSGVPLSYSAERQAAMRAALEPVIASGATHLPANPPAQRRAMFFGAGGSFEARAVARGDTEHPVPVAELPDALECPEILPPLLARIQAPVQWTIAEAENSSEGGPAVLAQAARLLERSRRVATSIQVASGHNISLHHVARAYHLRAFAFFEECLAA